MKMRRCRLKFMFCARKLKFNINREASNFVEDASDRGCLIQGIVEPCSDSFLQYTQLKYLIYINEQPNRDQTAESRLRCRMKWESEL